MSRRSERFKKNKAQKIDKNIFDTDSDSDSPSNSNVSEFNDKSSENGSVSSSSSGSTKQRSDAGKRIKDEDIILIQQLIGEFVSNVKRELNTSFGKLKEINFNNFVELTKPRTKNLFSTAILAPYEDSKSKIVITLCNLLGSYCELETIKEEEEEAEVTVNIHENMEEEDKENEDIEKVKMKHGSTHDTDITSLVQDMLSSIEKGEQYFNICESRNSSLPMNSREESKDDQDCLKIDKEKYCLPTIFSYELYVNSIEERVREMTYESKDKGYIYFIYSEGICKHSITIHKLK
jgi:hypothetical protein